MYRVVRATKYDTNEFKISTTEILNVFSAFQLHCLLLRMWKKMVTHYYVTKLAQKG